MATTRHLRLLRHTKASWDDASLADHDRPLAPRGVHACALLADHLRGETDLPDLGLCSPAVRTRQTLDGIRDALPTSLEVEHDEQLYAAAASTLSERLRQVPVGARSVLLIGHNPAVGELAANLAAADPDTADELRRGYPTGGLARFVIAGEWSELGPSTARLTSFVTPKQLG